MDRELSRLAKFDFRKSCLVFLFKDYKFFAARVDMFNGYHLALGILTHHSEVFSPVV